MRPERGGERRRGGQIGIAATAAGAGRDEGRERGEGNVECMRETGKVMEVSSCVMILFFPYKTEITGVF